VLLHDNPASERLLAQASDADIPVLSLPVGLRPQSNAEAAMRMAIVWLTVTLRGSQAARRVS
jgi:hypothetical protein